MCVVIANLLLLSINSTTWLNTVKKVNYERCELGEKLAKAHCTTFTLSSFFNFIPGRGLDLEGPEDLAHTRGIFFSGVTHKMKVRCVPQIEIHRDLLPDERRCMSQSFQCGLDLVLAAPNENVNLCVSQVRADADISDRDRLKPRVVKLKADDLSYIYFQTLG